MRHKRGEWIWVHDRGRVYERDADGSVVRMAGTHQEITARKQQEQLLARLSCVVRETNNGVIIADRDGVIEWVNAALERMSGYTAAELIGRHPAAMFVGPETDAATLAAMRAARTAGEGFSHELLHYTRSGRTLWVKVTCTAMRDELQALKGFVFVVTDVDERRRLEQARERSEQLLRETGRAAGVGAWSLEPQTGVIEWTEVTRAIHEVSDEFVPSAATALEFVVAQDRARVEATIADAVRRGAAWEIEYQIVTARGRRRWLRSVGHAELVDGGLARLVGSLQDVSRQHEREAAVQRERDRAQRYLDTVQSVMLALDADGCVTMINRYGCELLGWSAAELLGRDWFALTAGDDAAARREAHVAVTRRQRPLDGYAEGNVRCRDGTTRLIAWRAALVRDEAEGAAGVLCAGEDITARRALEMQANRAQRLEAIGTMAAGIAHDLNNALSPIVMSVELLQEIVANDAEIVDTLQRSARHAKGIVRQLLAFARGDQGARVRVGADALLRDVVGIVRSLFPKNLTICVAHGADAMTLSGDVTQLQQVLLNLCVNARDAMPRGGTLTLHSRGCTLTALPPGAVGAPFVPGAYVVFRVCDTGGGIPEEIRERIFEPFFTTKVSGQGTGLGLSMVLGITRSHGGFVRMSSVSGVGSTFEIYLPESLSPANELTAPAVVAPSRGGGELLLLVDDDPGVRSVAARIVRRLGYRLLVAADAREGLALAAAHGDALRAVITDVHMPEIDGVTFARQLRVEQPHLPLLVVSGNLDSEVRAAFDLLGVWTAIDKPFEVERLRSALSDALRITG
jgi:PAS domain S-box-containing protein